MPSTTIKNIAVVGVGGVGGYFGGKLCRLLEVGNEFNVTFIARGEHLRAIQNSGLLLSSEADGELVCKPSLATDDFHRLPTLDLCLICVKEFDLEPTLRQLAPKIGDGTYVLPLLNGFDVASRVRRVIRNGVVLPACVYVGTHIERPGRVVQRGGACRILFGPDPLWPDRGSHELTTLFQQAGVNAQWTPEIRTEIWSKFIFICAFGLVSAAYDKSLGEILDDDALTLRVRSIMSEALALARASGVSLPDDSVERSLAKAKSFPYEAKTSFQRDFERTDKKDERDLFAGSMIRLGNDFGIEAPGTKAAAAILAKRKPFL